MSIKGYTLIKKHVRNNSNAFPSVGMLIMDGVDFKLIPTPANWCVIGVEIFIKAPVALYSYYDNHKMKTLTQNQLETIASLSQRKLIIMGDFNVHSLLWDKSFIRDICKTYEREKALIKFIETSDHVLMNDGSLTRISPVHANRSSAIDLTIIHKELFNLFMWEVSEMMYNSDHLPCLLSSERRNVTIHRGVVWVLESTDWRIFNDKCKLDGDSNTFNIDQFDEFIEAQINAGLKASTVSFEYPNNKKRSPPWWNERELNQLRKAKNKALNEYIRVKTIEALIKLKKVNAKYKITSKTT